MSFAITLNKIGGPEGLHWEAIHGLGLARS
jgi:hypothetical protein